MPHLAPISWILVTTIFWICLLILISFSWWQQTPNFTRLPQATNLSSHNANWSW